MTASKVFVLRDDAILSRFQTWIAGAWKAAQDAGKPLVVICEPETSKRTTRQNALFWAMMTELSEVQPRGLNFSKNAWAEHFRRELLGTETLPSGQIMGRGTSELTVAEFNDFLTEVQQTVAEDFGHVFMEAA